MSTTRSSRPTVPPTVRLARGRHTGTGRADATLRHTLHWLKAGQDIDDFLELPAPETEPDLVFEARSRVGDGVTVRARLSLAPGTDAGRDWILVAEAEQPWDPSWPSPAAMFWPAQPPPDAEWNTDPVTGVRPGAANPLPEDDKAVRRLLRDCARDAWHIHVVVHEAMTPDERGKLPLTRWLPPGLRDRVVEHRAAPQQSRVANWALREFGVEVPRGGAVVLPGGPAPEGYEADAFAVRAVYLDGTEPVELVDAVVRYDALARALPEGAQAALTALREEWRLLTPAEELDRERALVARYAEALDAMTKSRDLYREAAERAHEALAVFRESAGAGSGEPAVLSEAATPSSPLQGLTRTLEWLKVGNRGRRSGPDDPAPAAPDQ